VFESSLHDYQGQGVVRLQHSSIRIGFVIRVSFLSMTIDLTAHTSQFDTPHLWQAYLPPRPAGVEQTGTSDTAELLEGGATVLGRMLLLTDRQLESLSPDTIVIDLHSGTETLASELPADELAAGRYGLELSTKAYTDSWLAEHGHPRHTLVSLTGSIGSGKSQVREYLEELGAHVLDADKLAHQVMLPGTSAYNDIVGYFGERVTTPEGPIDRKVLGEIVFEDLAEKAVLESFVYPWLRIALLDGIKERIADLGNERALIVVEMATLFETAFPRPEVESIVVVTAPRESCIARAVGRENSIPEEEAVKRYESQIPPAEKVELSDITIHNGGSLQELREKVRRASQLLLPEGVGG
jgi:dephospho-CoA kinase